MYTIIEDCSPYYIRFKHAGIDDVIQKCLFYVKGKMFVFNGFTHYRYPIEQAKDILNSVPLCNIFDFNLNRVSLFATSPGYYYRAHKDGLDHRYSINYTVKILDDKCVTSWYSDQELEVYGIDNLKQKISRECEGFDKSKHIPLKSMTAIQGECILFNTDIFHDFDNRKSYNERMVLTLRDVNPGDVYFEDARRRIFN